MVPEMKLETTDDVNQLLGSYITSAALGTALELQLFWKLAEKPTDVEGISQALGIPFDRCQSWLELLTGLSLLERKDETYAPSSTARTTILETHSPETWALLAQEAREHYPAGNNLTSNISHSDSVWMAQGLEVPNYVNQMVVSSERAQRFTRMLYEIHRPLAEKLAETIDMTDVNRLMDLGGGSGVVSLALLRRHPKLTSVVVDIANVCEAGRKIAAETSMADRITYHAADFLTDELPTGFDMILECDVGIYTKELFQKLHSNLNAEGQLVIVNWLAHPGRQPSLHQLIDVFQSSLETPKFTISTNAELKNLLIQAGFQHFSEQTLKNGAVVIQAHK
jgi:predicted O-methyltransferase YrrM